MRLAWRQPLVGLLAFAHTFLPLLQTARANPRGGQTVAGSAAIQGQGTANVVVNQSSTSAIINWNSFNIGSGEITQFLQPSASSYTLNRVTGSQSPSQILGTIEANGRIFLVNPDGFIFGTGAKINTASFLATTHDISNANFMAGNFTFNIPGNPNAYILNQGTITASSGGFAALVAPAVRNEGVIVANLGTVALAGAGKGFVLDLYGDSLIKLYAGDTVSGTVLSSVLSNTGTLQANGGKVLLTAATAQKVVDSVINMSGVVEAQSVGTQNGMVVFGAQTASTKVSGAPTQTVNISGTVDVSGKNAGETGGTVYITGEAITLQSAFIDASGANGGGKILVGGDYGGGAANAPAVTQYGQSFEAVVIPNATTVSINAASTLNASAITTGNGGKIVVWSGTSTSVAGNFLAQGGAQSGNGGFVETSGAALNIAGALVSTAAPNGKSGTWLLDPADFVIDASQASNIQTALAGGNVVVLTDGSGSGGSGDIVVNSPISWSSNSFLTLDAYHSVLVNANITASGKPSGLIVFYNDGGTGGNFLTGQGASVTFTSSNSLLAINGQLYTLLYTASDLQNLPQAGSGGYFALANNIDLGSIPNFSPISNTPAVFDGLGHTISNLTINNVSSNNLGLFSVNKGIIRNVGLINATVIGGDNQSSIGTLVGYSPFGIIVNDYATGSIVVGNSANGVGGLVGYVHSIQSSYASVTVTAGDNASGVGGLAGGVTTSITTSYATGSVTVGNATVYNEGLGIGGLVGIVNSAIGGSILSSYATGNVTAGTANAGVGGLAGIVFGSTTSSYATGNVTTAGGGENAGGGAIGGLVGQASGPITSSFATGAVNTGDNATAVGGLAGYSQAITSSYATGSVTTGSKEEYVGGLVGIAAGSIASSYATGNVTVGDGTGYTTNSVGGLAGLILGPITSSYATGSVTAGDNAFGVGGLTGYVDTNGSIASSYATGAVTAGNISSSLGTLVGSSSGVISNNNYSTGSVTIGTIYNWYDDATQTTRTDGIAHFGLAYYSIGGPVGNLANYTGFSSLSNVTSLWNWTGTWYTGPNGNPALRAFSPTLSATAVNGWDFVNTWYQPQTGLPLLRAFLPQSSGSGGTGSAGTGSGGSSGNNGSGDNNSGGSYSGGTSGSGSTGGNGSGGISPSELLVFLQQPGNNYLANVGNLYNPAFSPVGFDSNGNLIWTTPLINYDTSQFASNTPGQLENTPALGDLTKQPTDFANTYAELFGNKALTADLARLSNMITAGDAGRQFLSGDTAGAIGTIAGSVAGDATMGFFITVAAAGCTTGVGCAGSFVLVIIGEKVSVQVNDTTKIIVQNIVEYGINDLQNNPLPTMNGR